MRQRSSVVQECSHLGTSAPWVSREREGGREWNVVDDTSTRTADSPKMVTVVTQCWTLAHVGPQQARIATFSQQVQVSARWARWFQDRDFGVAVSTQQRRDRFAAGTKPARKRGERSGRRRSTQNLTISDSNAASFGVPPFRVSRRHSSTQFGSTQPPWLSDSAGVNIP